MLEELRVAKIQQWFLVFAAVVLLFTIIKWIYLWRRISSMQPRPQPPREEPGQKRDES